MAGDPQLLRGGRRAGLAVRQPALRDRAAAARRDPRAAHRRPPRRAGPGSGRIRTDLEAEGSDRNKVARELSPAALRTADRLVGRAGVGRPVGRRRPYLCHTLCELGAEPLDEQLTIIRRFLTDNPREVVVLFVEPYVPVATIENSLARGRTCSRRLRSSTPTSRCRRSARSSPRTPAWSSWPSRTAGSARGTSTGSGSCRTRRSARRGRHQLSCDRFRGERGQPAAHAEPLDPAVPAVGDAQPGHRRRRSCARGSGAASASARCCRTCSRSTSTSARRRGDRPRPQRRAALADDEAGDAPVAQLRTGARRLPSTRTVQ